MQWHRKATDRQGRPSPTSPLPVLDACRVACVKTPLTLDISRAIVGRLSVEAGPSVLAVGLAAGRGVDRAMSIQNRLRASFLF